MTAGEPSVTAALASLGFELEPGAEDGLDRAEVVALRDAAAHLAFAPEPLPPAASEYRRLMAALAQEPTPLRDRARGRGRFPLAAVLAGGGLLAAAAAMVLAVRATTDRDHWRSQADRAARAEVVAAEELRGVEAARLELDARLQAAEASLATVRAPALQVASFHGDDGGAARVMVDPRSKRWIVVAFELPAIDDRDYQLWLVPPDGAPISAGVLHRRADGVLEVTGSVPSPTVTGYRPAISLEPRGGSAAPTAIKMVGDAL